MTKQVHSCELACSEKDTLSENIPDLLNTGMLLRVKKLKSLVQLKLTVHEKRIM